MMFFYFLLAMLPIIWLIAALSIFKIPGHIACAITLALAILLAIFVWHLNPVYTASAVLEGVLNALWPICLVIVAALFTYQLTVTTGAMEVIKKILGGVSDDRRVLALLIGWGFGNFMEGMAGFGTAVAIPASMLAGIGLDPINSVLACLVANSTPTCFGSVGVPVQTLSAVTGFDALTLGKYASLMQSPLTFLSPFLVVIICGGGFKALKGMLPVTFAAALSFVLPFCIVGGAVGPELPNIIGAILSMVSIIVVSKIFNKNTPEEYRLSMPAESNAPKLSVKEGIVAWSPFILIFLFLMGSSKLNPPIYNLIAPIKSQLVVYAGENGATLTFSWINTPGVMIFLAAIIGGLIQKASFATMLNVLIGIFQKYWKTIMTVCCVMATAKIMGYSGMISDIANLLVVVAGSAYPLIAPLIGGLGGFVTGSGTSTCVLFGQLQSQTAQMLHLDPSWIASANVVGAGIGKMICPQSIAIGTGAIGMVGSESKLLGAVVKYFLLYVIVAGLLCMLGTIIL